MTTGDLSPGAERTPRRLRWGVRGGLVAAIAALVVLGLILRATAPEPEARAALGEEAGAQPVETLRLEPSLARARVSRPALLEGRRSVRIASETRGRVAALGAEALDRVDAGQLLVQVDPLTARVAVERAEAALARAESENALAHTSLERQRSLKRSDAASAAALDDARNRARVAEATIREARANLEQARDALAKKTILAPFDGVLRSFDVELGEFVDEGRTLGDLVDLASARLTVGLSDREIVAVQPGTPAVVRVEAYPNEHFAGEVLRVGGASSPVNGRFPVEIEIANPDGRLLPGMVARVELDLTGETRRVLVPREAVVEEYGLRFVFVVVPEESGLRARRRRVEVRELPFEPARLELVSGVRPGEVIATSGTRLLRDGAPVQPKGAAGLAADAGTDAS